MNIAKLEVGLDHIVTTSQLLTGPGFDFCLFEDTRDTSWEPWHQNGSLPFGPVATLSWGSSKAILPGWATRYGFMLENLPWLRFHALVYPQGI